MGKKDPIVNLFADLLNEAIDKIDIQTVGSENDSKKDQGKDQASENDEISVIAKRVTKKLTVIVPRLLERGHELGRRGLVLSRKEIKDTITKVQEEVWTSLRLKN